MSGNICWMDSTSARALRILTGASLLGGCKGAPFDDPCVTFTENGGATEECAA
jgi:hypothetical protein